MSTEPTHLARIRPTLPHGTRHVYGMAIERLKGWYPVTAEQAAYLAKQPANEGDPQGPKLFDAVTVEEAKKLDVLEKRPARLGGSASNPVGLDGFVPPEQADTNTRDLQERLLAAEERLLAAGERAVAAETAMKQQSTQLAAVLAKLGMEPLAVLAQSEPVPKDQGKAKDAVPQRPDRPGAVNRNKPTTGSAPLPLADDRPPSESHTSEG